MKESPPEIIPENRPYDVLHRLVSRAPEIAVDAYDNVHLRDPETESRIKISDHGSYLNVEEQLVNPVPATGMELVGTRSRVFKSPDLGIKTKALYRYTDERYDNLVADLQRDPYHAGVMMSADPAAVALLERAPQWRYSDRTDELFPRVPKTDKIRQPGPVHG